MCQASKQFLCIGVSVHRCLCNSYMEIVQVRSFLWSVYSCIWSKYGKMRTRKELFFWKFFKLQAARIYQKDGSVNFS